MLVTIKKIGVIITIAILFAFFSFSIIELINPQPDWNNFCGVEPKPVMDKSSCEAFTVPDEQVKACKGDIQYKYDSNGCPVDYECNTCRLNFDDANKHHRLIGFIVTSILGIFGIIVGLYAQSKNDVLEWVFSGILIGGIISIFIGTMMYFNDMNRFVKPIVLLLEIVLIVFVAQKTYKKK